MYIAIPIVVIIINNNDIMFFLIFSRGFLFLSTIFIYIINCFLKVYKNTFFSVLAELLNRNMFDPKPKEGRDGSPVVIPSHMSSQMQKLYRINRFNLMASDRIPLNRSLPDVRKKL